MEMLKAELNRALRKLTELAMLLAGAGELGAGSTKVFFHLNFSLIATPDTQAQGILKGQEP